MVRATRIPGARRAGFTLIEVVVSAVVLVIGCLGLSAAITSGSQLTQLNGQRMVAHQAARAKLEELENASFSQVFALYNRNAADDPGGAGTAPGADFAVDGLNAAAGDADGFAGEVIFPTVGDLGLQLCETVADARLGMPRDLDASGSINAGALSGGPVVIPVRVRVRWRGPRGASTLDLETVLIDRSH